MGSLIFDDTMPQQGVHLPQRAGGTRLPNSCEFKLIVWVSGHGVLRFGLNAQLWYCSEKIPLKAFTMRNTKSPCICEAAVQYHYLKHGIPPNHQDSLDLPLSGMLGGLILSNSKVGTCPKLPRLHVFAAWFQNSRLQIFASSLLRSKNQASRLRVFAPKIMHSYGHQWTDWRTCQHDTIR